MMCVVFVYLIKFKKKYYGKGVRLIAVLLKGPYYARFYIFCFPLIAEEYKKQISNFKFIGPERKSRSNEKEKRSISIPEKEKEKEKYMSLENLFVERKTKM
jgi:hypothetical protein